jgi:hypothetical protein
MDGAAKHGWREGGRVRVGRPAMLINKRGKWLDAASLPLLKLSHDLRFLLLSPSPNPPHRHMSLHQGSLHRKQASVDKSRLDDFHLHKHQHEPLVESIDEEDKLPLPAQVPSPSAKSKSPSRPISVCFPAFHNTSPCLTEPPFTRHTSRSSP